MLFSAFAGTGKVHLHIHDVCVRFGTGVEALGIEGQTSADTPGQGEPAGGLSRDELTRSTNSPKRIKIALQGGGAHGALAWGVLDRLLEDDRIAIEALCGTSAGAMNASVTACGLIQGGPSRARELLQKFWEESSAVGMKSPFRPTLLDDALQWGSLDYSPWWCAYDMISRVLSPYELNPRNWNPLKGVIAQVIDFEALRTSETDIGLFVCATNVLTNRLRVFHRNEITPEAVLASACLPFLFQAMQVNGEWFWDGGYMGNPPIFPLIYAGGSPDILIVQINPITIREVPRTAQAILDRINTLSFNSSLMREMKAIDFMTGLLDCGQLDCEKHTRIYIHTIDAEAELQRFSYSSKLNPSMDFLRYLFQLGREKASMFLDDHFDEIGNKSSTDIKGKFL